ncbi:MAG: SH3 domain-containing protein [Synergistaceae bacterium]|nr:SH3 domain-containing protein [Synergistaceae bacterium]
MKRGSVHKNKKGVFPIRIAIPLIFLIVGVGVAYALLSWDSTPEPRPEPIIIRPEPLVVDQGYDDPIQVGPMVSEDISVMTVEPVSSVSAADQFSNPARRVAGYKINSAALRKTVDKYGRERANQCAGEITVRTDDTPLNVRSGPSTANPVVAKAAKDSKQSVLLWAPDEKTQSGRWFLLVDAQKKTVRGWVSGEYCDAAGVVFPQ